MNIDRLGPALPGPSPEVKQAASARAVAPNGGAPADSQGSGAAAVVAAAAPHGTELLNKLQGLNQSSPSDLKQVLATITRKLQAAARRAKGARGHHLANAAARFQKASETGDLSTLQPRAADHPAVAAYQQASGQSEPLEAAPGSGTSAPNTVREIVGQVLGQASPSAAAGH